MNTTLLCTSSFVDYDHYAESIQNMDDPTPNQQAQDAELCPSLVPLSRTAVDTPRSAYIVGLSLCRPCRVSSYITRGRMSGFCVSGDHGTPGYWDESSSDSDAECFASAAASMPSAPGGSLSRKSEYRSTLFREVSSQESKYRYVATLGSGAFATCFLVQREADQFFLCLKRLSQPMDNLSKEDQASVRAEVAALKAVSHENITSLYESFACENIFHIAMEYCCGDTLADLINRRRQLEVSQLEARLLPDPEILPFACQIFLALAHIHSHNIIHRDLKPANILLHGDGKFLKICDFGISKISEATMAQTMVGTPYYLAPEVCEGLPYGEKCDLWAAGVVLHELCSLSRPFDGESLPALIFSILRCDPPPITTLDRDSFRRELLSPLVRKLLAATEDRISADDCCTFLKHPIHDWESRKDGITCKAAEIAQSKARQIATETNRTVAGTNSMEETSSIPTILQTPSPARDRPNEVDLFSPLEAPEHREKFAKIFEEHKTLWLVYDPPQKLTSYLHADLQDVVIGGGCTDIPEDVDGSANTCFAIGAETSLGWGTNNNGQLGKCTKPVFVRRNRPELVCHAANCACCGKALGRIRSIACRDRFAVAVTESDEVFVWGGLDGFVEDFDAFSSARMADQTEAARNVKRNDEALVPSNPFASASSLESKTITPDELKSVSSELRAIVPNEDGVLMFPLGIHSLNGIRQVACGFEFALFLGYSGLVYSFGNGDEGCLGLGDEESRSSPSRIPDITDGRDIRCGAYHSLCVTEKNQVFSWGGNDVCQLGYALEEEQSEDAYWRPYSIPCFEGKTIVHVACGWWHSAAIVDGGLLYTWGNEENGRLGLGSIEENPGKPSIVPFFEDNDDEVVDVSCGAFHSAAITKDGLLYTWGSNEQKALGRSLRGGDRDALQPGLVKNFSRKKSGQQYLQNTHLDRVFCGIHATYLLCTPNAT